MRVTFLFWNVFGRSLEARIARIAVANSVDVLMLAECHTPPASLLAALNASGSGIYRFPPSLSSKIKIFTRFPEPEVIDQFNARSGRLTIRRLRLNSAREILLGVVHLASKVNLSDSDQGLLAAMASNDVCRVEDDTGNHRTVLVGDFNMNPFEEGIVGAQNFHAVMTKQQALGEYRTVQMERYRYFYNPMWGNFGDRTDGPAGTYHLSSSKPIHYFWNMYDQVLLRPALMDKLTDLKVLTDDGVESLVTRNGLPQKNGGSDHLPLLFRLDL